MAASHLSCVQFFVSILYLRCSMMQQTGVGNQTIYNQFQFSI